MDFSIQTCKDFNEFTKESQDYSGILGEKIPLALQHFSIYIFLFLGGLTNELDYDLASSSLDLDSNPCSESFSNATSPTISVNCGEHPSVFRVSLGSSNKNCFRLGEKLTELSTLKEGWDGELAMKPSNEAINQARFLIGNLDDDLLEKSAFFPSNDAGIYLQGILPKGRFTLFLDGKKCTFVVKSSDNKLTGSLPNSYDSVLYLNKGLRMYV